MARPKKQHKAPAERARAGKTSQPEVISSESEDDSSNNDDVQITAWTGGVNYIFVDSDSELEVDGPVNDKTDSEWSDVAEGELQGKQLRESLKVQIEKEIETLQPFQISTRSLRLHI